MMFKKSVFTLIQIGLFFIIYGCGNTPTNPVSKNEIYNNINFEDVIIEDFSVPILSFENLPNTMFSLKDPNNKPYPVDSAGIELFQGKYYHPGILSARIEHYLDGYYQTKDTIYMHWINKYFDKLMSLSEEVEDAILFPFSFDWYYKSDFLPSPWYSAMTQGVVLMDATRLFEFTGDSKYLNIAHKVFNGYYFIKGKSEPWITMIDENNYLWLEEYPFDDEPIHVLNGMVFSIQGLYEYYKTTGNKDALFLLKAAMTTIKDHIGEYRNKNGISFYSMKYKETKAEYHPVHVYLLDYLSVWSNDPFFSRMSDIFKNDYP